MRILLVSHHYAPENNAPQRRWSALAPRLLDLGNELVVFAPPPHYPTGTLDDPRGEHAVGSTSTGQHGETVHRVRFREHGPGLRSRSADQAVAALDTVWRALVRLRHRADRPDVVVSTAPGLPSLFAGWVLAFLWRVPHVVEMRDAWPDLIHASGVLHDGRRTVSLKRRVATHAADRAVTWVQRRAAAVVTTTDAFAEVLRSRGMRRVEVVRNGAPVDAVPALERPRDEGGLHVLYVGTVGRSQGLETAVEAAAAARALGIDVRLRIVGGGALHSELQALASTLGAPVEFVGRVLADKVPEHYLWADTVLVSLRDWPPFAWTVPSKLYEALAVGRHISAAVTGEAAHLVSGTGAGTVVPPGDVEALVTLWGELADDRTLLRTPSTGREWARANAGFAELAAGYDALLREVVR